MRTIKRSSAFKRDYNRELKGKYGKTLNKLLPIVLRSLVSDQKLAPKYRDHALTGNWTGYRECHIKPDLLLIYHKHNHDSLHLVRIGTHSKLFNQ